MNGVKRHELKFIINPQEAWILRERLAKAVRRDPHCRGPAGYFVRSLYFDNWLDSSYYDRLEGMEHRIKFRVRLYEFGPESFLKFEIKIKHNDLIEKKTAPLSRKNLETVLAGDFSCLVAEKNSVLNEIYYHFSRKRHRPVVIVDYFRDAFELDYNQIRVTLDTGLRKSQRIREALDPDLSTIPVLPENHVILEIKYHRFFPSWLQGLMGLQRFQRSAQSKYCFARLL